MKRSTRQLAWQWVLMGVLLMGGGATSAWAQNTFPASGNVGIGTTSPRTGLHVSGGGVDFGGITLDNSTTGGEWRIEESDTGFPGGGAPAKGLFFRRIEGAADGVMVFIKDEGNVGIGTATPQQKLDIVGGNLLIRGGGRVILQNPNGNSPSIYGTDAGGGQNIQFRDSANANTRFFVDMAGGNVGIGTTSPTAKLHVAGDAQVDGNLAAKYQDVAEWVQTPSPLTIGTVVIIDPQGRNQVLPASQSYDPRVAGVVSARPGLLLGEAGEGKVKVAQSGRVKVKVDATYGPIAAGDLLVTSPTPGHAMRSTPVDIGRALLHRPGTLLGKALEQLEGGRGEILVLLTLQ